MTETRRRALKMLGTIGATCAFPFSGDELYGQHVHSSLLQSAAGAPYTPAVFTGAEYSALSRLTDAIIPPTDTAGASSAGVPEYIDRVASLNTEHQPIIRAGLAWLEREAAGRFSRPFGELSESEQMELLRPVSDELDREQRELRRARFRTEGSGEMLYYVAITDRTQPPASTTATAADDRRLPVTFLRLIKNLTADGYYTSRAGLLQELGYAGNTALLRYPACPVPEQ
jgi:gluconate 2-dehydrogenase gamma chain